MRWILTVFLLLFIATLVLANPQALAANEMFQRMESDHRLISVAAQLPAGAYHGNSNLGGPCLVSVTYTRGTVLEAFVQINTGGGRFRYNYFSPIIPTKGTCGDLFSSRWDIPRSDLDFKELEISIDPVPKSGQREVTFRVPANGNYSFNEACTITL